MKNKNVKPENLDENQEDVTKYGEFISSYFAWVPLETQKEKVNRLENITNNRKEDKNK